MNEWPAAIWASISAMTAALVLTFIMVLGSLGSQSARVIQEQDDAVAILQEYREFSRFDGTIVYPQDIITVIVETGGHPEIWVDTQAGAGESFNWKWTKSTHHDYFTVDYLTGLFPTSGDYESKIVKDRNGAIIRIEFRRL